MASPAGTGWPTATCSAWTAARYLTGGRPTPRSPSRSARRAPADARLIATTGAALRTGIAAAVPGARIGDISAAIGATGRTAGYGICTDFGGHGVGRAMHEDPHIPNEGPPRRGRRLVPGLVIAIEPWFLAGGQDVYRIDADGWTIRSGDGSRAAHVEHTVAITEDGPHVLTVP